MQEKVNSTDIDAKLKEMLAGIEKELNIKLKLGTAFPVYNILPDEVVLALKVLNNHGMQVQIGYEIVTPEEKK